MNFKPLLVFSNPYDCKPVIEALKNIPYDQLHLNYFEYPKNILFAQDFFLENTQYSHLIINSPDVVPNHLDIPLMEKMIKEYDFEVYGPCCNVDQNKYKNHIISCFNLPSLDYDKRRYKWLANSQREQLILSGNYLIEPKFNGLAWCYIRRDVVEKIPFCEIPLKSWTRPIWEKDTGYAVDLAFCHYADFLNIPIKLDLRIKWSHLRYYGPLLVGKKQPTIKLIKKKPNFKT